LKRRRNSHALRKEVRVYYSRWSGIRVRYKLVTVCAAEDEEKAREEEGESRSFPNKYTFPHPQRDFGRSRRGGGGLGLPQLLSHALLAEELGGVLVEGGLLAGGGGGAQVVLDEPMGRAELLEAELAVADDDDRTLAAAGEGAFLRKLA
jgi:hypothetical protein